MSDPEEGRPLNIKIEDPVIKIEPDSSSILRKYLQSHGNKEPQENYEFDSVKEHLEINQEVGKHSGNIPDLNPQRIISVKREHSGIDAETKEYGQNMSDIISQPTLLEIKTEVQKILCENCGKEFDHIGSYSGKIYQCEDCLIKPKCINKFKTSDLHEISQQWKYFGNTCGQQGDLEEHEIQEGQLPYVREHQDVNSYVGSIETHPEENQFKHTHLRTTCEKSHKCEYCGKKFTQKYNLKTHIKIHTEEKQFKCRFCEYKFRQKGNLIMHERIHTGETPFECEHCEKKFKCKRQLKQHLRKHTKIIPIENNIAQNDDYVCSSNGSFETSTNDKQLETKYLKSERKISALLICGNCGKKFSNRSNLRTHIKIHMGEKPFECQFCGNKFAQKGNLITHERMHTGEAPYKCQFCENKFKCSTGLKRHVKKHTENGLNENKLCQNQDYVISSNGRFETSNQFISENKSKSKKLHACGYCGKKFTQRYNLKTHIKIHMGVKSFECQFCGAKFTQKCNLIAHTRIHTGEAPFKCQCCEKNFKFRKGLKKHLRIHTENILNENCCEFCGKQFSQKGNLTIHMKIHTGVKPFECQFCEKKYTQKCNLITHVRIHTGETPFECEHCEKRFKCKKELKRHLLKHEEKVQIKICQNEDYVYSGNFETDVDQFSSNTLMSECKGSKNLHPCEYCGKQFSQKSNLTKHMKIHTGVKPFECQFCGKKYTQKCNLITHVRIHTRETPFECEHCEKRFKCKKELKRHSLKHAEKVQNKICQNEDCVSGNYETDVDQFSSSRLMSECKDSKNLHLCEYCGKKFTHISHLRTHMNIHTGVKPFECQFCGKKFTQKCNLITHVRIHTGETPFECELCEKKFKCKKELKRHLLKHAEKAQNKACQSEDYVYNGNFETDVDQFSSNILMSECKSSKNLHLCEYCGKKFTKKCNLTIHMKIHTGVKPFECQFCEKKYTQKCNLITHVRIHTGETPFECEHCGKRFKCKKELKRHLLKHEVENKICQNEGYVYSDTDSVGSNTVGNQFTSKNLLSRYKNDKSLHPCEYCGKKFTQRHSLKTHTNIHMGIKPFECQFCKHRFTQKCNLIAHVRIHTGETPFECEHCEKRFKCKKELKRHLRQHSETMPNEIDHTGVLSDLQPTQK